MGSLKNQKDKVVGNAKEKIGEILNKENLIDEIEDQQAEEEAKRQDLTQERKNPTPDRSKTPLPESDHIPDEQKIEEQRMKHYTGIEEKL